MEIEETEKDWKQGGLCKICEQSGKRSFLKIYQINFDEAITFCEDETCSYPLGLEDSSELIVNRNFTEISTSPLRRHSTSSQKPFTGLRKTTSTPLLRSTKVASSSLKTRRKVLAPYVLGQTPSSNESVLNYIDKNGSDVTLADAPTLQQAVSDISLYSVSNNSPSQLRSLLFPQWQNKDALCWLDVVMCLFVHSRHLQRLVTDPVNSVSKEDQSVLLALVKAYNQACALVNNCTKETYSRTLMDKKSSSGSSNFASYLRKGDEDESKRFVSDFKSLSVSERNIKTGAGLSMSADFNDNLSIYMKDDYQRAFSILNDCRESLFQYLQPSLKCLKGRNDSPVFAIPLLARGNPAIEKMMKMKYIFQFHCKSCGYRKNDDYENFLPTFPNTDVMDFNMKAPAFSRPCFKCSSLNQSRVMVYESIGDVMMIHFVQGLQSSDVTKLEFDHSGKRYTVTGLIQYRNDPDHFVTWIKDNTGKLWLEYDDLKSPVSQFKAQSPLSVHVPPGQIHIVMWEASPLPNPTENRLSSQTSSDSTVSAVVQGKSVDQVNECKETNMETSSVSGGEEKKYEVSTLECDKLDPMIVDKKVVEEGQHTLNGDPLGKAPRESQMNTRKSTPFGNKGIMMVAFTANGSLVHVPLVSAENLANSSPILASQNGTLDLRNYLAPGLSIQAPHTNNQNKPGSGGNGSPRASGPRQLTPLTAKSQISLLKSLRAKKNSIVQDVEARSGRSSASVKKQPLARRNSSATKSSDDKVKVFDSSKGKTIPGRRNSAYYSNFSLQGRKFASYKEYSEESWSRYQRDLERQSSCSPVSEISDFSAPCSPAPSCHSDSVLFQKRKSETSILFEDPDPSHNTGKRRRSNQGDVTQNIQSDSLDDDFINEILSNGTTLASSGSTSRSEGECAILQNLYSALNMSMPESTSPNPSATNNGQDTDLENLPEVNSLATFIESDSMNTLDDFLAQL